MIVNQSIMWLICFTFVALAIAYWLLRRPHKYWVSKGVKQGNPGFILGDNWGTMLQKQSFAEMVQMMYDVAPNSRYSGAYQFLVPTLIVRDLDLIKQITVKDFDHFLDHRTLVPEDCDPLWGKNLLSLTGKRWRNMRSTLSPAFTSSKMKYMFSTISQSGEQFVKYFLKKNEDVVILELKDTLTRFTNDVIANAAFGIECDSLTDPKNEFYTMGKELTDLTGFRKLMRLFGYLIMPAIFSFFKVPLFAADAREFFTRLVSGNIESREKTGIVRHDMLGLLLDARKHGFKPEEEVKQHTGFATVEKSEIDKNSKNDKITITDEDITAQAMIFFFGGFDSVSSLMCFMSYELAVNQDVQERLIQEVDETLEACNGKITYEALFNMKYMDMVVSECLRKWPNAVALDRICTKPYTIEPKYPDEKPLHLKEKDWVWVPTWGLHHDPQYYPNPERFDPERFSDQNKRNIKPYTYLPFGAGPRNCIGSRFALLEAKTLFFYILSHFQIIPVAKTQIPLVLSKKGFNLAADGGFWFGFKRRCIT